MSYCKRCYLEKVNPNANPGDLIFFDTEDTCESCNEKRFLVDKVDDMSDIMTISECNEATRDHIELVRRYIKIITDKLTQRGIDHDRTKTESPEVELFAQQTKKLAALTYDSEEYQASLELLKPALDHHYANNRHHPEHFKNGIDDMTLVDIVEMLCDWKASSMRLHDGNLLKSVEINAERFKVTKQLLKILENTVKFLDEDNG